MFTVPRLNVMPVSRNDFPAGIVAFNNDPRFTAKFLLRLTEEFRSRAVAGVVDVGLVVGVFTVTSPRARNSCFLWKFRSRIGVLRGFSSMMMV